MEERQPQLFPGMGTLAKGGAMVFGGTVFFTVSVFVLFALIARNSSTIEFGFFCLGYAIIKILSILTGLGLSAGLPRYISFNIGQRKYSNAWSAIISSFIIMIFFSLFISLLLFFAAEPVSKLLNKPLLTKTLQTMSAIIPFMVLNELLSCYLRGLKDATGKVYFQQILRPLLAIILVGIAAFFDLSYVWIVRLYALSFLLTFILLFLYAKKKILNFFPREVYSTVIKEIVVFSLPLLGSNLLSEVNMWIDTMILGVLASAELVGIYHGALRIAMLLPITLVSAGFIYLPLVSDLFAQKDLQKISTIYALLTKWIFVITLPLFYFIFFGQKQLLFYAFGAEYIIAGPVLQLLSLGFIIHVFFGLNGMTCIAFGKVKALVVSQVTVLIVNFFLDLLLIPKYGIVGASIASSIALVLANMILTGYAFGLSGIHPFSKEYIKLISYAIGLGIIFSIIRIDRYLTHSIVYGMLFLLVMIIICFLGVILTRNLTEADVNLMRYIEQKISRNSRFTDKVVKYLKAH